MKTFVAVVAFYPKVDLVKCHFKTYERVNLRSDSFARKIKYRIIAVYVVLLDTLD